MTPHSSLPLKEDGRGDPHALGHRCLIFNFFTEAAAESHLRLLSTVAQAVKGQGTICWVDCGDAESRKLCKKMKVDLSPKDKKVELFHYQDGAFHTEYNRAVTFKVNLPPSFSAEVESEQMPKAWQVFSERRKGRLHR